jgi:hypothetical protein
VLPLTTPKKCRVKLMTKITDCSSVRTRPLKIDGVLKERCGQLYKHFERSVVTWKELLKFGTDVCGIRTAVTRIRRFPECRTAKKGVYRLNFLLDANHIPVVPQFERNAEAFVKRQGIAALKSYQTIKESELDWLLVETPNILEEGLTHEPESIKRIKGLGEMDHFFRDVNGNYLIVEVKRYKGQNNYREAIGQTILYMGWVKSRLAKDHQKVRGTLIVGKIIGLEDPVLKYAQVVIPDFSVRVWDKVIVPD